MPVVEGTGDADLLRGRGRQFQADALRAAAGVGLFGFVFRVHRSVRLGVDSFGQHHLVLAAFHWLHLIAGAGVCRAAARERQDDRESQTEADFTEEVVFRFHNCVFLFVDLFFGSYERRVRKFISGYGRLARARGCYPQQPPDFSAGFEPAGVDRNFCRQGSLQK